MASGSYQYGAMNVHNGAIDLDTTTLKAMLIGTGYTFQPDDQKVDIAATSTDLLGNELTGVSGYTGGHGGAGRQTVTVTMQVNDTSNRLEIAFADITWTTLGTGGTIGGVAIVKPGTADDTTAIPIYYFDVTDTPTNGGNITVDFATLAAGGNVQVNCG